jgi:arabinosyltransferase C
MRTVLPPAEEPGVADSSAVRRHNFVGGRQRALVAMGAAAVALVAALFVAVGPANRTRGVYQWRAGPPSASSFAPPLSGGDQMPFTPLLLSKHAPASLSVHVPCAVVQAAAPSDGRFTVLATAKNVSTSGLSLVVEGQQLRLGIGGRVLAEAPWLATSLDDPICQVSAGFRGEKWHLSVGGKELRRGESPAPVVTGLFTQLPRPAHQQPGLSIRIVTAVAGSSPSARQVVLILVTAGAGLAALVLLLRSSGHRRSGFRKRAGSAIRSTARGLMWVDVVVLFALGAWWFFGPVIYDDGWLLSVVLNFPKSGAFSNYYDVFDAQYPLGFLHFLFLFGSSRVSSSLLWMRVPVLFMGIATWGLLRAYLARLRGRDGLESRVALAAVFLVFWFAWLSTLRPEPMVALLAVVVIVELQRFSLAATRRSLVVAVLAATVAITLHPVGVIAAAPILIAIPSVWGWARERGLVGATTLVTLGLLAAAAFLLLVTADTDLSLWRQNQHLFATQAHLDPRVAKPVSLSWRDELLRYQLLFQPGLYSSVVRRASVLFGLIAVVLFITRPARSRDAGYDLPVMSLMAGLVLMALTPSKWPWLLGALGGVAALAVATEVRRLGLEPRGSRSRNRRALLVVGATVVASAIAWRGGADFGVFTVRDVDFGKGGSGFLGVDLSSPLPWLALVAGALVTCAVVAALRRRLSVRSVLDRWLALTGLWAVPVAAGVVVTATLGLFVTDAFARNPGWSLPRQNYDDLTGQTCGMADDIGVADPTAGTPLALDLNASETGETAGVPDVARGARTDFTAAGSPPSPPGINLGTRWGSQVASDRDTGVFFSPWFVIGPYAADKRIDGPGPSLFTAGKPNSSGNALFAQFGRSDGQTIRTLRVAHIAAPDSDTAWHPLALEPPRGTDRIRIIAVDQDPNPGGWLAFSAPQRVRYDGLAAVLTKRGTTALVGQDLRIYFPCVTNPGIRRGFAQAPDYFLGVFLTEQSPLAGISDLYPSQRLLTRETKGAPIVQIDHIVKPATRGDHTSREN